MTNLTQRDRELVALGAAMGSNCAPCIEYHIPEARKAGLADAEIAAAIRMADMVRQVPARKTLQTALENLPAAAAGAQEVVTGSDCGCATAEVAARAETQEHPSTV